MWPAAIITGLVVRRASTPARRPSGSSSRSPCFGFALCLLYCADRLAVPVHRAARAQQLASPSASRRAGTGRSRCWSLGSLAIIAAGHARRRAPRARGRRAGLTLLYDSASHEAHGRRASCSPPSRSSRSSCPWLRRRGGAAQAPQARLRRRPLRLRVERAYTLNARRRRAPAPASRASRGIVRQYVAGQRVNVRFYRARPQGRASGELVAAARAGQRASSRSTSRPTRRGDHCPRHRHRASRPDAHASRCASTSSPPRAAGATRACTCVLLQRRLRDLRLRRGPPGIYDDRTARAVMAFRKVTGMDRRYESPTRRSSAASRTSGGRFRAQVPAPRPARRGRPRRARCWR